METTTARMTPTNKTALPGSVRRTSFTVKTATVFAASGTVMATTTVGTTVMNSVTCVNAQTRSSAARTGVALLSTGTVMETRTVKMDQMRKIALQM